jgi:hypothetical protein
MDCFHECELIQYQLVELEVWLDGLVGWNVSKPPGLVWDGSQLTSNSRAYPVAISLAR